MDPIYYTRIAMAGWVFLAVILCSAWDSGSQFWKDMLQLSHSSASGLLLVFVGAIIGIGAPPALGFLFERIASMILWPFKRNMWQYSHVITFGKELTLNPKNKIRLLRPATFHIFFYTFANSNLLTWARRRRTQIFASLTSAIAIFSSLPITILIIDSFSFLVFFISIVLFAFLIIHTKIQSDIHMDAINTWVITFGQEHITEFENKRNEINNSKT
jgi:hypothetical protein